jgi:phosphate transport system ATP-binding protein
MREAAPALGVPPALDVQHLNLWYGDFQALFEVDLSVRAGVVTALIGPSGCGKSTLLRCCNRIHERQRDVTTTGTVRVHGVDAFRGDVSRIQVRRQVGMVFQRPNPLPMSIRDNVLFGHRLHRERGVSRSEEDAMVESALREVLLWDRVKNRLEQRGTELSLEEQQRLCIARLLPTSPSILLMDEPCSALDPEATSAVEDLIWDLRGRFTILLVTHDLAQARRTSDECVFMLAGRAIEHSRTDQMFVAPLRRETADYLEGRSG